MNPADQLFLERALQLARRAVGVSLPNPMVGAVIVDPQGRIIGEGFTDVCGRGHAEVNAVASVAEADKALLPESTMYVTLEPCAHYGKTPPCARLLCDIHIHRVVIGTADPFAKVCGRGIAMLHQAGIKVEMAPEDFARRCRELNRKFFTAHRLKRPFVTLKWARSSDGWLDRQRSPEHPGAATISTPLGRVAVHKLRAEHDAILVGSTTYLADRPQLDCRAWTGRNPQPVVLDVRSRITDSDISTKIMPIFLRHQDSISGYLHHLYNLGITSLLVEGGSDTLRRFIKSGLWDEAREEVAPVEFGSGGIAPAPLLPIQPVKQFHVGANYVNLYSHVGSGHVKNL